MQQKLFKDKYPIFEMNLPKAHAKFASVAEMMNFLGEKIADHPIALEIARFDHYAHTKAIGGEINPAILDAQNLIFCFGMQLPSADPVAVRPRSIGITEFADHFVINFMEAPVQAANDSMQQWVQALKA
ncbi:MAG: hypothetical protein JXR44_07650 [Thiotrichales bacterium]|nr:hypothetical protein [Thiotrichales bacterium]